MEEERSLRKVLVPRPSPLLFGKVSKESKAAIVKEKRLQVNKIYNLLAHHEISADTAVDLLNQQNIYPSREFQRLASVMNREEVSLVEFTRALTESAPAAPIPTDTTAGLIVPKPTDTFAVNWNANKQYMDNDKVESPVFKPTRKPLPAKCLYSSVGEILNTTDEPSDLSNGGKPFVKARSIISHAWNDGKSLGTEVNEEEVDPQGLDRVTTGLIIQQRKHPGRAKLNHGDCITWTKEATHLEILNAIQVRAKRVRACILYKCPYLFLCYNIRCILIYKSVFFSCCFYTELILI